MVRGERDQTPERDDGDALAFCEASKQWPTQHEIDRLPHTHGEGGRIVGIVISKIKEALGF